MLACQASSSIVVIMAERIIYLVRNAHAGTESDGPSEAFRPVSDRGYGEATYLGLCLPQIIGGPPDYILRESSRRSQLSAQLVVGNAGFLRPIEEVSLLEHSGKSIEQINIDVYRAMLWGELPEGERDQVVVMFMSRRAILAALQEMLVKKIRDEQAESYVTIDVPTNEEIDRSPPHDRSIIPTMTITRVRLSGDAGRVSLDYYGYTPDDALAWRDRDNALIGRR